MELVLLNYLIKTYHHRCSLDLEAEKKEGNTFKEGKMEARLQSGTVLRCPDELTFTETLLARPSLDFL